MPGLRPCIGKLLLEVWSKERITGKKHRGARAGNYFLFLFSSIASFNEV